MLCKLLQLVLSTWHSKALPEHFSGIMKHCLNYGRYNKGLPKQCTGIIKEGFVDN